MIVCYRGHAARPSGVKCVECVKITNAEYHTAHAAKICGRKKQQRAADPTSKRQAEAKWLASNLEYKREAVREYFRANPDVFRANSAKRRARINGSGGRYTPRQIADILQRQKYRCAACDANIRKRNHADHIIPVCLGGSSNIENIQMLCPACNMSKGGRHPIEWAQQKLGRLL